MTKPLREYIVWIKGRKSSTSEVIQARVKEDACQILADKYWVMYWEADARLIKKEIK